MSTTPDNTYNPMDDYLSKMLDGTITPQEMEQLTTLANNTSSQELVFDYQKIEEALRTIKPDDGITIPIDFLRSVENTLASKIATEAALLGGSTISTGASAVATGTTAAITGISLGLKTAFITGAAALLIGGGYWGWTSFSSESEITPTPTNQSVTIQSNQTPEQTNAVIEHHDNMQVEENKSVENKPQTISHNNTATPPKATAEVHENNRREKQFIQGAGNIQNPNSPIVAELEKAKKELDEKRNTANDAELMQLYFRAGILYVENGFTNPAREHLDKALQLSRKIQSPQTEGNVYGRLAMLEARQQNIEKAKEYYKKAIEILKPVGGNYERWENELKRLE